MSDIESLERDRGPSRTDLMFRMPALDAAGWSALGPVARWVVMVRAAVLVMTVTAAGAGILIVAAQTSIDIVNAILLIVGLTAAHATNNLLNDWIDWRQGLDRNDYFRARYGTHVLDQELVSQWQFAGYVAATGGVALGCGLLLSIDRGLSVLALMGVGAVLVVFYTWPLKRIGLGELAVLAVWGPLIIGGSVHVLGGSVNAETILLSLAFGIAPTLVILGKHVDKAAQDRDRGVGTLPVIIGEGRARALAILLLGGQWGLIVALAAVLPVGLWLVLCVGSVPAGWQLASALMSARPFERPGTYPAAIWPLWFSALAFRYARLVGGLLVLALALRLFWS